MDTLTPVAATVAVIAVIAVILDSAFMWPQAIKLARTRDIAGVSALTWTFGTVFSVMWAAYAATIQLWPLFASNVACTAAAVVAMAAGTRAGWPVRYAAWSLAGSFAAIAIAITMPVVVVTGLTAGAVLFAVPQFLQLLRAPSVTGVSATTWWLNIAVSSSWLTVAVYEGAVGVVVANTASILALAAVLVALYARRLTSRGDTGSGGTRNDPQTVEIDKD